MEIKRLMMLSVLSFGMLSSVSYANINVKLTGPLLSAKTNGCDQIQGKWSGQGTIQSVCKYKGSVVVSSAGSPNNYNLDVNLVHDSWYFWCPDPHTMTLPATCNGSTLAISINNGTNLSGETDGHTTRLSGSIVLPDKSSVHVDDLTLTKE